VILLAQAIRRSRFRIAYPDIAFMNLTDAFGVEKEFLVGGEVIATALVGSLVSPAFDPATPWTGRLLVGFNRLGRTLDSVTANQVAVGGVTVLEDRPPNLRVRQGLTTDFSNVLTRTPTVITIADEVQQRSRTALDPFIGVKFLAGILSQVESTENAVLKSLLREEIIAAFTGVNATPQVDNPTAADIEAFYQPVFPLLYLVLTFGVQSSI